MISLIVITSILPRLRICKILVRLESEKLVDFIMLLRRIRKSLKEIRPDLVYVTPNACGGAFYKDYIVKGIKVILLFECLYSDVMKYVIMCE